MDLGSIEFKALLNRFGNDLQEVNDDLYLATKPTASRDKRDAAITVARRKLEDYDILLAQLDEGGRDIATQEFDELVNEMRRYLLALEERS